MPLSSLLNEIHGVDATVPEGHVKIARRFKRRVRFNFPPPHPVGMPEPDPISPAPARAFISGVPLGRDSLYLSDPASELAGYCQRSLRDVG